MARPRPRLAPVTSATVPGSITAAPGSTDADVVDTPIVGELLDKAGLVNNAGLALNLEPAYRVPIEDWETMVDTNIKGLLYCTRLILPGMVERNAGHVVNISSVAAVSPPPGGSVYSATKAAVDAITSSLAKELGPRRIRVNSLNPGMIETEGFHSAGIAGSDFQKTVEAQTPLGRIGQPDDIGPVAVFLASEDARWVTGQALLVSGGHQ